MPITKARFRISDYNSKRKARLKGHERKLILVSLSLTPMVDMFAILVIFLLTNSASVTQWVEVGRNIQLPKAKHSDPPPKAATLQISRDAVFGDNKALISNSQIMQTNSSDSIKTWLMRQGKKGGYVNIVAHERVPYGVIRRVISACQDAGFKNVNLAVQPKS